jgi:hypothetical protein
MLLKVCSELLRGCLLFTVALEEGATTSGMIKLDSSNYSLWKPMMEDIFYCKDLYQRIVEQNLPTSVTEEEWRVLNRKAIERTRYRLEGG